MSCTILFSQKDQCTCNSDIYLFVYYRLLDPVSCVAMAEGHDLHMEVEEY